MPLLLHITEHVNMYRVQKIPIRFESHEALPFHFQQDCHFRGAVGIGISWWLQRPHIHGWQSTLVRIVGWAEIICRPMPWSNFQGAQSSSDNIFARRLGPGFRRSWWRKTSDADCKRHLHDRKKGSLWRKKGWYFPDALSLLWYRNSSL